MRLIELLIFLMAVGSMACLLAFLNMLEQQTFQWQHDFWNGYLTQRLSKAIPRCTSYEDFKRLMEEANIPSNDTVHGYIAVRLGYRVAEAASEPKGKKDGQ